MCISFHTGHTDAAWRQNVCSRDRSSVESSKNVSDTSGNSAFELYLKKIYITSWVNFIKAKRRQLAKRRHLKCRILAFKHKNWHLTIMKFHKCTFGIQTPMRGIFVLYFVYTLKVGLFSSRSRVV